MDEIEAAIPATPPKKHRSLTPRVLLQIAVAVLVLAGAGFGGYYYLSQRGAADAQTTAYVEVPTLLINLRSADGRARFLKVRIVLETHAEATTELNARMPALVDAMQGFLRELRPEDLAGATATFRLKEELLVRANQSAGFGQVTDVLIQELVQQ